jgi:hypothetical protein
MQPKGRYPFFLATWGLLLISLFSSCSLTHSLTYSTNADHEWKVSLNLGPRHSLVLQNPAVICFLCQVSSVAVIQGWGCCILGYFIHQKIYLKSGNSYLGSWYLILIRVMDHSNLIDLWPQNTAKKVGCYKDIFLHSNLRYVQFLFQMTGRGTR